jgi:ABC-type sugar transport system ATPase subunit
VVQEIEELGSDAYAYAAFDEHADAVQAADLVARIPVDADIGRGDRIRLRIKSSGVHLFSAGTGESLA